MRKLGISEEMIAQMNARFRSRIPMGRIGTGDDIARAAPFLASGEAGSVTGVELAVDGGHAQV
jgi:NAD(P)-dependent dehydrogenase (short-subunit alcohol dehydrogenase family)